MRGFALLWCPPDLPCNLFARLPRRGWKIVLCDVTAWRRGPGGALCDVKKALSAARMPSAGPRRGGGRERGAPRGCAGRARRPLLLPRRELRGWVPSPVGSARSAWGVRLCRGSLEIQAGIRRVHSGSSSASLFAAVLGAPLLPGHGGGRGTAPQPIAFSTFPSPSSKD